jgi:hypothetical protein
MRLQPLLLVLALTASAFQASNPAPAGVPPLSAISFMSGCWTGPSPNGAIIEEHNTEAAENLMIGMTRYVRGGRVVDFEFTTIERTDTSFVMTPRVKGVKTDSFPLKTLEANKAVWENLAHDFPQRIIYRKGDDGSLIARIEGTTPRGERHLEWVMQRCQR